MFKLKSSKHRLHMVVKNHAIRYVISKPFDKNSIVAFGESILPRDLIVEGVIQDSRRFEMQIEDILNHHRLKTKILYFAVPDSSVIIRHQKVPEQVEWDEVKGYLYSQLGESIHLPYENPVFDHANLGEYNGEKNVLFVAYPEERLNQLKDSFNEVKLKPEVAELTSFSVYRLYESYKKVPDEEHILIVEWNIDGIVLTVFNKGIPQFSRQMKSNLDHQSWKVTSNDSERWLEWRGTHSTIQGYVSDQLEEMSRIMNFYKFSVKEGKAEISKVLLTGDWTYRSELFETMNSRFSLLVETVELDQLEIDSLPNRFADVVGLSFKGSY
ncbi:type IV pilus biogenesis protein PilM [Halobacillus seohaensis]|uniref:Type IV pilus biogenesis protein PilM n=1 Tax=Halobacillus seohaensis TaxID=447421 RepID=A0ABW2EH53_9BACI